MVGGRTPADVVVDAFQVVTVGKTVVAVVRRGATLGHRGHPGDPLHGIRGVRPATRALSRNDL